jgi:hypothetical protein
MTAKGRQATKPLPAARHRVLLISQDSRRFAAAALRRATESFGYLFLSFSPICRFSPFAGWRMRFDLLGERGIARRGEPGIDRRASGQGDRNRGAHQALRPGQGIRSIRGTTWPIAPKNM